MRASLCGVFYCGARAIINHRVLLPSHERIARNLPSREELSPDRMTACHAPAHTVER